MWYHSKIKGSEFEWSFVFGDREDRPPRTTRLAEPEQRKLAHFDPNVIVDDGTVTLNAGEDGQASLTGLAPD